MNTESSRQLVLDYYQALGSANPAADLKNILADDVEWHSPPSSPIDDVYHGRDTVLKTMRECGVRFFDVPTMKAETKKIIADGDTVVVLQSVTGKAANGRDYSNEYVWIFTCANGKIVRMDEHNDSLRFNQIVMKT